MLYNIDDAPPGWRHLVEPLIEYCADYGIEILQIKEKFGRLRFYVDKCDDILDKMIENAEVLSSETCQDCGEPGRLTSPNGWMLTLCEKHEKERKRK